MTLHIIAMLRQCIRTGEQARRLLEEIEAQHTPANDAPPPTLRPEVKAKIDRHLADIRRRNGDGAA